MGRWQIECVFTLDWITDNVFHQPAFIAWYFYWFVRIYIWEGDWCFCITDRIVIFDDISIYKNMREMFRTQVLILCLALYFYVMCFLLQTITLKYYWTNPVDSNLDTQRLLQLDWKMISKKVINHHFINNIQYFLIRHNMSKIIILCMHVFYKALILRTTRTSRIILISDMSRAGLMNY